MDPPSPPHESTTPKIFINDQEFVDHESVHDDDNDDIYRGDRPSSPQSSELGSATSQKSFSTASSGSFRLAGGRLGALATRLERAITRWARKNWADSSSSITSSGSSDSSHSSFRSANKSSRRKRRPPSLADIQHREESVRAVAARIKAREIGRAVPREFNLYSPSQDAGPIEEEQRVVRTFSLDVMLPHLNPLLGHSGKPRPRHRSHSPRARHDQHHHLRHLHPRRAHSAKDESSDAPSNDALHGPSPMVEKGKDKISSTTPPPDPLQTASTSRRVPVAGKPQQAWWLDVSSPSWEDMKTLGRLLHLHPLTLEDILQREPREKLELFPKLGYYFIVLRAVESSTRHERLDIVSQKTGSSQLLVQGVANETCIYLVVFRDGICSFHFSNISEHLERVRGKLQSTAQTTRRSSAWIAHGILDSVVDSFFPLVEEIEEHVMAIESVVHNEDNPASTDSPVLLADTQASRILAAGEKVMAAPSFADEKHTISRDVASVKTTVTRFSLPRLTCGLMLRRGRRAISRFVSYCTRNKSRKVTPSFTRASFDLYRMARTRQLATSVARVLATKPEVVAGIRKRLLASVGPDASDEVEIAIYFGDVQDHILTLQQSLAHYERMLSESHPMYIQNLHFNLLRARAKGDYAMFVLAMVTVMVVPPSVVTGIASMNVHLPRNNNGEFWIFGVVLVIILGTQAFVLGLVRYWWVNAKRGHRAMLE